jgi:cyclophilin family peptidyl-prolyl cis-trans isomerase
MTSRVCRTGASQCTNTGACQFFITDKDYASLNGEYTIFGQVVDGQDVVVRSRASQGRERQARTPVKLISATIKRYGPPPCAGCSGQKSAAPAGTAAPKKAATRRSSRCAKKTGGECVYLTSLNRGGLAGAVRRRV